MSALVLCTDCGASIKGSVAETLAWDKSHRQYCPGKPVKP